MKIARLIDGKWTPEALPTRWSKTIPATTKEIDGNVVLVPEKIASIPIANNPDLGWQWIIDIGYIDPAAAGVTVAPILGDLPVCNDFQQCDTGTLVDGWVTFAAQLLPEPQLTAKFDAAEERLIRSAEAWQENHPQGIRGTGIHLVDRLVKHTEIEAPKGHATETWIRAIWTEQMTRNATMRATNTPPSYDFSTLPAKPHSLEELLAEEAALVGA